MKLKDKYIELANEYLFAFADMLGIERRFAIWEDRPAGTASVAGFTDVKYHNIRYTIDNNLTREQFTAWYNRGTSKQIDWSKHRPYNPPKHH